MVSTRRLWELLFCSVVIFVGYAPPGVGQVPAEDGPDLLLWSPSDYGSLRSSLEALRDLSTSPIESTWFADLRFRKTLEVGANHIYSGTFVRVERQNLLATAGSMQASLIRSPRSLAYIHQEGQSCAIPPDALFEGLATDKLGELRFDPAAAISLGIELDFVIFFLEQVETGDPQGLLGPLASTLNAGSSMALVDLEVTQSGPSVELVLDYEDLSDPSEPATSYRVTGVANSGGFGQVVVQ